VKLIKPQDYQQLEEATKAIMQERRNVNNLNLKYLKVATSAAR
jgi:hypothetical protein